MKITSTSSSRQSAQSSVGVGVRPLSVNVCPACRSTAIQEVVQDWAGEFEGQRYVVPKLRLFACPTCGERVYPPEAMRRIQALSPAYRRHHRARKSA